MRTPLSGVQEGDKIGIVGINGTGKSTLLQMIAGEDEPDEGQLVRQNGKKTAYLLQSPCFEAVLPFQITHLLGIRTEDGRCRVI